ALSPQQGAFPPAGRFPPTQRRIPRRPAAALCYGAFVTMSFCGQPAGLIAAEHWSAYRCLWRAIPSSGNYENDGGPAAGAGASRIAICCVPVKLMVAVVACGG